MVKQENTHECLLEEERNRSSIWYVSEGIAQAPRCGDGRALGIVVDNERLGSDDMGWVGS